MNVADAVIDKHLPGKKAGETLKRNCTPRNTAVKAETAECYRRANG
jgi:hypothetical protein